MKSRATIADFYQHYGRQLTGAGQAHVYRIEDYDPAASFPHIRSDFYKIKLLYGVKGTIGYADHQVEVGDTALIFANPLIPYSWELHSGRPAGFVCLFTESFINEQFKGKPVADSPLFRVGSCPVLFPDPATVPLLTRLFEQLLAELQSGYEHKYELMRNYIQIIIHESLKMSPALHSSSSGTSAARLSASFLALLEGQFPVASRHHTLALKNANEFALRLSVHTNHLNKALKEQTGKTTTEHIAGKIADEARALLRHSDWSIGVIGGCLGFGHATNFNTFFKKQAGLTPQQYRLQASVLSSFSD